MRSNEFITSDTHFGHKHIIGAGCRPFKDVDEMDNELVRRWNAKVPKNATVYHLGDFAFLKPEMWFVLVGRLNGTICLISGNHDQRYLKKVQDCFRWIKPYHESKTDSGKKIVMCHYPLMTWNAAHYGAWMLHGHSHGNLFDSGTTRMDVGVDTHPNYEPYSFEEINERLGSRVYSPVDHHKSRA